MSQGHFYQEKLSWHPKISEVATGSLLDQRTKLIPEQPKVVVKKETQTIHRKTAFLVKKQFHDRKDFAEGVLKSDQIPNPHLTLSTQRNHCVTKITLARFDIFLQTLFVGKKNFLTRNIRFGKFFTKTTCILVNSAF